ncbi:calcium-binding protein [Cochlodiniinecator piscidefendens]|uniref:calcium-binding protein n=1 Tax=Cochlodiniinecator piscidefendens TaxID=2715756 RepID=UPI001E63D0F0|nr:calcium-binding protein [Cochlodiniinecator piscidefendens]
MAVSPARADTLKLFVFGNSLINFHSGSDETTVPHWLAQFASLDGHEIQISGQWGFLRNFADTLPPEPNWSFSDVEPAWNSERESFTQARFDAVMINPANFIQYQPADTAYDGENPDQSSPLSATLEVMDWVHVQAPDAQFYIYEGWSEMAGYINGDVGVATDLQEYYEDAVGPYHAWYEDYVDHLQKERPDYQITLIPVAQKLAQFMTETPLAGIAPNDLYVDTDPHGTATLYALASAITYSALFENTLPEISFPDTIHPLVNDHLFEVRTILNQRQAQFDDFVLENFQHVVARDAPSLAMGLNGIADWSTQHPFVDLMKTARPWTGHIPGQWGGRTAQELEALGILDAAGWVTHVPEDLTAIETLLLTDQPTDSDWLTGRYRVTYEGTGDIQLTGRARRVQYEDGEMWFSYEPGEGQVGIQIRSSDPDDTGDYIRNISVVREDNIPLFEVGAMFNPEWVNVVSDLRSVRFMDWMFTNGSEKTTWQTRANLLDYTYIRRGTPVEVMVALANEIGADPWFNMPHMAQDDYVRNFAFYVLDNLNPELLAYIEYSNELWNFGFPQTHWVAAQAQQRWGDSGSDAQWMEYAGLRAAEMMAIWTNVFGPETETRLRRVIATHTDWPGLEEPLLQAPLWQIGRLGAPADWFDAYAVTGYFGLELGTDEVAPEVLNWIEESRAEAEATGREQGLARVRLRLFAEERQYESATARAIEMIRDGSLKHLVDEAWPYQAEVARDNNFELVMYEGSTHVVGLADWSGNDSLTAFFNHLNYTPEMAELYEELLTSWQEVGGTLFNAFVDVSAPSQYGSWGTLRYLGDENTRNDVLTDFNQNTPAWWSDRDGSIFDHGVMLIGGDDSEEMSGTTKADIILAGDGDDILTASGTGDRLHGGEGRDAAVFSGAVNDYAFEVETVSGSPHQRLIVFGSTETYTLFAIEDLLFQKNPGLVVPVADLQ